jgi:hypothetical protein
MMVNQPVRQLCISISTLFPGTRITWMIHVAERGVISEKKKYLK